MPDSDHDAERLTPDEPVTLGRVVDWLEDRYPPHTAESWDAVGLVCGRRDAPLRTVLVTVDVTDAAIAESRRVGAELIVAHHPLLLRGIHTLDEATPKGRRLTALIKAGIGLYCAHTNADTGPHGTVAALASALGLIDAVPLQATNPLQRDKIITFVPDDHVEIVLAAMAAAGGGAIGAYDSCSFRSSGTGRFRPLAGADPFVGTVGEVTDVAEQRLEMITERARRGAVLAALKAAHPYETPAYDVIELAPEPSGDGFGRVGAVAPTTLRGFAEQVAAALPAHASGVRVAGDPDRPVRRVAVLAGAGDSFLDAARHSGADVYVTSDLRHHPADEALAWDGAPALVDIAHAAAEWLWLPPLADAMRAATGVEVIVTEACSDPWTFTVPTGKDRTPA